MSVAIVTGSAGLIGSESAKFLHQKGFDVVGIDNNMRKYFFGEDGSTCWNRASLESELRGYSHKDVDIRDEGEIERIFRKFGRSIELVIHAAAQPSHDWAANEPLTDFSVNATGTLNLLEASRKHCKDATFIFTSTNKVYGDTPNSLPFVELSSRWEVAESHHFAESGIDESMSIDNSKHSIFGASKVAADVMVQEYGRYFAMNTGSFRGGCLTGPAHSGAELHGFLAYLVKCAVAQRPYTIFGYKGKQVRDNIHSHDLISAFWHFHENPSAGAVYNIGGSRFSNCSVLEAIGKVQELCGQEINYEVSEQARAGDHIWWVTDVRKFRGDYPSWDYVFGLDDILSEMVAAVLERQE